MNLQIASRLEINLLDAKITPQYVSEFTIKYKIPVIVSAPEYVAPLVAHRAVMNGSYRVISTIDFPKGKNYAMDKLFRSNPDFVGADGFEILLSTNRTEIELRNEMRTIRNYLKANRPLSDIRWCLRMHSADPKEIDGILKSMKEFPPSYVRVDPHVEDLGQDLDRLKSYVEKIREYVPYPIKIGGGLDLTKIQALSELKVQRFDVSFEQAEAIVKTLKLKAQEVVPHQEKKQGPAVKQMGSAGRIRI